MEGQALLQIPGENPGWLEALQVPQHALDVAERAIHAIGNLVQIDPQVTRLVEVFHQGEGNHAVGRIVQLDVDLADDAVAQRLFGGQPVLKIKILTAFKATAAAAAPVFKGDRRSDLRVGRVIPPLPVVVNLADGGGTIIQRRQFRTGGGGFTGGITGRARHFGCGGVGRRGFRRAAGVRIALVPFQQRVLFQLAFDVLAELDVRQLQQLDGLLQLGRHDQ